MGIAEKVPATTNALVLVDGLTPDKVYGTKDAAGLKAILEKIEKEVRGTVIDVSTEAGREAAKSVAYKVARSKTALDDMGKSLVEDWKKSAKAVDAERKTIRDTLDGLKAEVLRPVEDWETAEQARVTGHINAITEIEDLERAGAEAEASEFVSRLARLHTTTLRDFQEFTEQAATAREHARTSIKAQLAAAVKREAERAELEQLRAEKAARDKQDAERVAAEQTAAKAEANRIAAAEAEAARKLREEQIAREAAEKAVADAEAERKRKADAEATAQAARERNHAHRTMINDEAARDLEKQIGRDVDVYALIDAVAAGSIRHISITY